MSLYDGLDVDAKPKSTSSDLSGWGSSLKLLETQKQLQAKKSQLQNLKKKVTSTSMAPVIDLKGRKSDDSGPVYGGSLRFNQHTGKLEHIKSSVSGGGGSVVPIVPPFIGADAPLGGASSFLGVTDEYDPLRPNDYETFVKLRKIEKQKEREARRAARGDEDDDNDNEDDRSRRDRRKRDDSDYSDDDDDDDRRRKSSRRKDRDDERDRRRRRDDDDYDDDRPAKRSGAAIAPPPSLLDLIVKPTAGFSSTLEQGIVKEDLEEKPKELPGSKFGLAGSVASKIMARMGYKEGQGLGKSEQGMSIALQVEKTGRRAGKIIHERDLLKAAQAAATGSDSPVNQVNKSFDSSNANLLRNPTKVIVLRNMVGPGEVDEDLESETAEECAKFGKVNKCLIFELHGVEPEEAVRIFLEFEKIDSAIKALVDLNGRFFGGRVVRANFYNVDKFHAFDLGGPIE